MIDFLGALFVIATFIFFIIAFNLAEKTYEVIALSKQSLTVLTNTTLDDQIKETTMRWHAKSLGQLFLKITGSLMIALGLPLAIIWLLNLYGYLSFHAVIKATLSWQCILLGIIGTLTAYWMQRVYRGK